MRRGGSVKCRSFCPRRTVILRDRRTYVKALGRRQHLIGRVFRQSYRVRFTARFDLSTAQRVESRLRTSEGEVGIRWDHASTTGTSHIRFAGRGWISGRSLEPPCSLYSYSLSP